MGTGIEGGASAVGNALFGAARQAVLRTLFGRVERRFYQRQLIRMLGLGSGAVQRELARLAECGILQRQVEGHQTYFQANRESAVFEELRALVRKTFGVAGVLRDALAPLADRIQVSFIYGSVATGQEQGDSDIDVIAIGEEIGLDDVVAALGAAQKETGREINPSVYRTDDFRRKLAEGSHFLSSIIKEPKVFLIGGASELTRLARVRVGERAHGESAGNRRSVRGRRART